MSTLTIRNVSEDTHARLRARAASHGHSVEAEVRQILDQAVDAPEHNILLELAAQVRQLDLPDEPFEIPRRQDRPRAVRF